MLSRAQEQRAEDAITAAVAVREKYRRRTRKTNEARNEDIEKALVALKRAMRPVRSFLAKTQYNDDAPGRFEALNLSFRMQRERRKLWKMQRR